MQKQPNSVFHAIFDDAFSYDYSVKVNFERKPVPLEVNDVTALHYHNTLELGYCEKGEGVCYINDKEYPFQAGDVHIAFPYQPHLAKNKEGQVSEWYWLNLDCEKILDKGGFTDKTRVEKWMTTEMALCGIFNKDEHREINRLVKSLIFSAWDNPKTTPFHSEIICSYLYTLILTLLRESYDKPKLPLSRNPKLMAISPALIKINDAVASGEAIHTPELAAQCAMSVTHFRRIFNEVIGVAPKEYITSCFIRKGEKLLITSDCSILDISTKCGFSEVSGFNRAFSQKNNMTPTEFRKKYRKA